MRVGALPVLGAHAAWRALRGDQGAGGVKACEARTVAEEDQNIMVPVQPIAVHQTNAVPDECGKVFWGHASGVYFFRTFQGKNMNAARRSPSNEFASLRSCGDARNFQ